VGLSAAVYLLVGRYDLGLMDEGYLWYGTLRTAEGLVPIRDFQAYDPGRYWWCAAWSAVCGEGILGLRLSVSIFQALGLYCGLLVVRRVVRNPWWLVPLGILLAAWMFPRHKMFESALAMIAVYAAVRLHERPTPGVHFACGIFAGLAAVMGRNHGIYVVLGLSVLVLYEHWKLREGSLVRKLGAGALGIVVGYAPILAMLAFVPGFAPAFVDSVLVHLREGANLPIPYPWPWRIEYGGEGLTGLVGAVSEAIAFLLPALVYPIGAAVVLRLRGERLERNGPLVASVVLGVFYSHHAAVRSAPDHIAQCIHPAILALLALPAAFGAGRAKLLRATTWTLFAAASFFVILESNRALARFRLGRPAVAFVEYEVGEDTVLLHPDKAVYVAGVERAVSSNVPADEPMFIAPMRPTFYPLLGKVSPTRDIYFFWPDAERQVQEEILSDLREKDVRWALIIDAALDDREDLTLRRSHPLVWEFLRRNFQRVPTTEMPQTHVLLRRRDR